MSERAQRILVVDDEEMIRSLLCEVLAPFGYEVLQAVSGEAGLEVCREHAPNLVITDIGMPGMDGYEFISAIRKEDAETPILVLAGVDDDALEEALECGANAMLYKPFNILELASKIAELVEPKP